MIISHFKSLLLFSLACLSAIHLSAQVTVSSLDELKPYLSKGGITVKLAPGTYEVTAADVAAGKYDNPLFLFEGNNSTYDFTGVTINIDTEVMRGFGSVDFRELKILGNNNVIKNLTMVDVGSSVPTKRATNIVMDGQENRIEGLHMTVRGSYPYGYGDIFGKGGPVVIRHQKHSALLIRGYRNHVKDCTIIHRAYGHGIFMQAADEPLIENCYVEGEVRSTDDILAEEGTGSDADKVDFETIWGYRLPRGYVVSLQEAGIRAYDAGSTYINGEIFERPASNVTVLNCTIVNMRTGATLTHAEGTKYVEGTTALGCESGFAIGSGDIVNCYADAKHGPVYTSTYESDRGVNVDITIVPSDTLRNGTGTLAYIGGIEHNFTFRSQEEDQGSPLKIQFGGQSNGLRDQYPEVRRDDHVARYVNVKSEVWNPLFFTEDTRNVSGEVCGFLFEDGVYNQVTSSDDCRQSNDCHNIASVLTATCYNNMSGITNAVAEDGNLYISNIQDGDWSMYSNIDISDMSALIANVKSQGEGGSIEVRLDDVTGKLLTTIEIAPGSEGDYEKVAGNIDRVHGLHDIYFVYNGEGGDLFDIKWFSFTPDVVCSPFENAIEAECYSSMDGIQIENCSQGGKNVSSINDGNWTMYRGIDLTNIESIKVSTAAISDGGTIEMYIDRLNGAKVAEISVTNSGGWQTYTIDSAAVVSTEGVHDVYLLFKGESKYLFNFNSLEFSKSATTTSTVDVLEDNPDVIVFPNPFADHFVVSNGGGTFLQLFNAAGELKLSRDELSDTAEFEITTLPSGVYFLKISTPTESITRKIIKR